MDEPQCATGTIASGGSGSGGTNGTGGTSWTAEPHHQAATGLAATCGPLGTDNCCKSLLVPGGTFDRSYDGVDFTDPNYPATVSDFYLDKYEITVGRFRRVRERWHGNAVKPANGWRGCISGDHGLWLGLDVEHESGRDHGCADNRPEV